MRTTQQLADEAAAHDNIVKALEGYDITPPQPTWEFNWNYEGNRTTVVTIPNQLAYSGNLKLIRSFVESQRGAKLKTFEFR